MTNKLEHYKDKQKRINYLLQWSIDHKEEELEYARIKSKERRAKIKLATLTYYSTTLRPSCNCCRVEDIDVLCIDHIEGGGKKHREQVGIGAGWKFYEWLRKQGFPDGYQVLCFNCNIKKYLRRGN